MYIRALAFEGKKTQKIAIFKRLGGSDNIKILN